MKTGNVVTVIATAMLQLVETEVLSYLADLDRSLAMF